ncbi:MAG: helix-hairpin-helix domain-containing protein [Proteobacteria bacterium]|nr:helix-hairpin-helix domain-containing protein [Pseudomonadota bacterium]MBU1714054.1 helix-hairpin-helix domain-containing protein [Pseudomonadota bacterium]
MLSTDGPKYAAAFIPPGVTRDQRPLVLLLIVFLILMRHFADLDIFPPLITSPINNQSLADSNLVWLEGGLDQSNLYLLPKSFSAVDLYEMAGLVPPELEEGEVFDFGPFSTVSLENHQRPRFSAINPVMTPFFFRPLPVNQADRDLLMTVRGIGPGLANKIIELREAKGGFLRLEELLEVSGIGPVKYDFIRRSMVVEPSAAD